MKKEIIYAFLLTMLLAVISFAVPPVTVAEQAVPVSQVEQVREMMKDGDIILIDSDGVLVYLTGDWYIDNGRLCHEAIIANDTDFGGYMYEDDSLVNGWLAEGGYSYTCPAHGKNRTTIRLSLKQAGVTTLEEIQTIQLNVKVEKRKASRTFTLSHDTDDVQVSTPAEDDMILIDESGVLVYLTGDWYIDNGQLCHDVVIENETDFSGYMYEDDSLVNGCLAEGGYSYTCPAYGKNRTTIRLSLKQAGVTTLEEIRTIRLNVRVQKREASRLFTINSDEEESPEGTPTPEDMILIDDSGVLVYLTGDWYIDNGRLCHDAMIVNDTDFSGYMYEDDSLVNGWLAEGGYSYTCPAHGKNRTTISLSLKQAGVTTLEEIQTIRLNVKVEKREASQTFTINPDAEDRQVSTPAEDDMILIDESGVLVYLTGDWYIDNGRLCHAAMIVNETDFKGYMYEDDSLVNGWMAEGGYSYTCPAYGKSRATISLSLKQAGVTTLEEIQTIQLNVRVEKREASQTFTINPDAEDRQVSTPTEDDMILIDESGVLVYLTGDWYIDNGRLCHAAVIVNETDFKGYMYEDDSLVNGWLAEGGYSYTCPAYGKNRATISLSLKQAGVTTLEEIRTILLNVRVQKREASQLFTYENGQ